MVSWGLLADGFTAKNVTLQTLIKWAYGVEDYQVSGAVKRLNTEYFNVEAKVDSSTTEKLRKLTSEQRRVEQQPVLQALLADRFSLTVHRETKDRPNVSTRAPTRNRAGLRVLTSTWQSLAAL